MKRAHKCTFFIVLFVIIALTSTTLFGISSQYGDKKTVYIKGGEDIRWGIDIRGGVDATFTVPDDVDTKGMDMEKQSALLKRLSSSVLSARISLIMRFTPITQRIESLFASLGRKTMKTLIPRLQSQSLAKPQF